MELDDESVYNGLIVERTGTHLVLAENLQEPENTVRVARDRIVELEPLDVSPMPTGLLVTLTREEVLDLLAYIAANGDAQAPAFGN